MNTRHIVTVGIGLLVLSLTTSCKTVTTTDKTVTPNDEGSKYVPRLEVVKIFIGGAFGQSYEVYSDGYTVRYKMARGMFELQGTGGVRITPNEKQWVQFRKDLDDLNVWKWQSEYINKDIADGTSWRVIIADGPDRMINTYGSNAYPKDFERFLAATRQLIGNRDFK